MPRPLRKRNDLTSLLCRGPIQVIMRIPNEKIGRVIGKEGSTINHIRQARPSSRPILLRGIAFLQFSGYCLDPVNTMSMHHQPHPTGTSPHTTYIPSVQLI